jgi:hypothetical protein
MFKFKIFQFIFLQPALLHIKFCKPKIFYYGSLSFFVVVVVVVVVVLERFKANKKSSFILYNKNKAQSKIYQINKQNF